MESKIQPILCCVGAAVAGQPTQFLMERAFEAAQCDWRVITVEVQPENFQVALNGMRAMSFTALRFFPELQPLAATLTHQQPPASLGAVTSAMRQGANGKEDQWEYWDNQGFGILDLIESASPPTSTLIWLIGQSRLTTSLYHAIHATGYSPNQLLWSDTTAESAVADMPLLASQPPAIQPASQQPASEPSSSQPSIPQPIITPLVDVEQRLKDLLSNANLITHLVVVGESLACQLPRLSQLEVAGEIQLLMATNQRLTRQQVNEAWTSGKATIYSENDQLIAAEAYDFKRWTGLPADLELLRDAYDEYADF